MDFISMISTLILVLIGSIHGSNQYDIGNNQYDIQFEVIDETSEVTSFGQVTGVLENKL